MLVQGIYELLDTLLRLMSWAIIIAAIFSTLAAFGVLDTRNRLVWSIGDFLYRVTEPVLRPVRNVMPAFGTVDLSPLVVLLLIQFIARPLLTTVFRGIVTGNWTLV